MQMDRDSYGDDLFLSWEDLLGIIFLLMAFLMKIGMIVYYYERDDERDERRDDEWGTNPRLI